jgi:hypothetical protein
MKLHNHQAHPLRISLPTKRDSLTRCKTGQPTIKERPTGEASITRASFQPLVVISPKVRQLAIALAHRRGNHTTTIHSSQRGEWQGIAQAPLQLRRAIGDHRSKSRVAYWATYKASNPPGVETLQSLSALPPYSRKPGPYGPTMSVCAKVMSRGVHNIAFSLSPDGFWAFNLEKEPESELVTPQGPFREPCVSIA